MSHAFIKAACASAGLVLALAAAGTAQAAKPIANSKPQAAKKPLTIEQKIAMGDAMARSYTPRTAPKTMAQAAKTVTLLAKGGEGAEVSEDLHNYLSVVRDAQGNLHMVETEGAPQPGQLTVGVSNEK